MTAPAWLTERPIAHRGLHRGSEAPENSQPAFQAAIDAGLPIELDVQLTADGQLVVHHDKNLGRLTEERGPVRGRSLDELTAMTVAGGEHRIMSFPEVLGFVDGRVPLLVEIKSGEAKQDRAAAAARDLRGYTGEFAVQSFDPFIIGWFRKNAPEILRGQISGSFSQQKNLSLLSKKARQSLVLNVVSRPHFIAYELAFIGPKRAAALRRLGKPLLLWTITTEEQRRKAERLGDNFIFEGFTP